MAADPSVTEEEVYIAELVEQLPNSSRRELNLSMLSTIAISIVFLMLAMSFGKAVVHDSSENNSFSGEWWETPIHLRHQMDLPMDMMRAQLPVNGTYEIKPYTEHFVEVELPLSEQDVGSPGADLMHVALWLPEVEEGVKIPVIMTIHPYYDFGGEGIVGDDSSPNTVPDGGVGKWVYDTFVPHGYALAQASTFGTGQSTPVSYTHLTLPTMMSV